MNESKKELDYLQTKGTIVEFQKDGTMTILFTTVDNNVVTMKDNNATPKQLNDLFLGNRVLVKYDRRNPLDSYVKDYFPPKRRKK